MKREQWVAEHLKALKKGDKKRINECVVKIYECEKNSRRF